MHPATELSKIPRKGAFRYRRGRFEIVHPSARAVLRNRKIAIKDAIGYCRGAILVVHPPAITISGIPKKAGIGYSWGGITYIAHPTTITMSPITYKDAIRYGWGTIIVKHATTGTIGVGS
jgi:hypothetical protein